MKVEIVSTSSFPLPFPSFHKVVRIRQSNPCATLEKIGQQVGITHERVRQILYEAELPTKRYYQPSQLYECLNCRKPTPNKKYCSKECRYEHTHPLVECDICHQLFRRRHTDLFNPSSGTHNHYFCSKSCQGRWLAKNYGWRKGVKNEGKPRKYDYDLIWNKHLETGYGSRRLARILNISEPTISNVLSMYRRQNANLMVKERA